MTEGDPLARAFPTGSASRAGRLDPASFTTEDRLDHRSPPVQRTSLHVADDLMTGDEGEADDVVEVARAPAVQRGEIRAADPGEAGPDSYPAGARHLELLEFDELERADADALPRADEG
jgi:hypothetical protein